MLEYDPEFYERQSGLSRRSADIVVPLVLKLFPGTRSVVDVGCGVGTWLAAFADAGVEEIQGIDGPYVRQEDLQIPADRFLGRDLTKPFGLDRRFDLAMSLEVAEYLPASSADHFVAELCALSDHILFSCAIPGQGGKNHINENLPSYWIPKFEALGYGASDPLRSQIWDDERVAVWYRQNAIVFVKGAESEPVMDLAHPFMMGWVREMAAQPSVRQLPHLVTSSIGRAAGHRIRALKKKAAARR